MANKNRSSRMITSRARRFRWKQMLKEKQARLQLDQQEEDQGIGPKLNPGQDQSSYNLAGYSLGCCSSTIRVLKAYVCSKCLLWYHAKCIHLRSIKDREALKNKQWVCSKCKENEIIEENEMKKRALEEVDNKILEAQNKEKAIALKSIDDLKLENRAIEMKLEDISKWVKNKFGADIPEEITTEAEMEFEYIQLLKEQYQSLSKSPVIELKKISGIEEKRSEMKNQSLKIKQRSLVENEKAIEKEKERRMPMKKFMEKLRKQIKARKEDKVLYYYPSRSKNTLPKNFKFPRENCEMKYANEKGLQLNEHIKYVHENKKVICHYCGKLLYDAYHARMHIKRIHEHGSDSERFECPEDNCNKSFVTKCDLIKHKTTHCEPVEYIKCTEEGCLKRFKNIRYMKSHLEIHAAKGARNLACTLCDKTFATRNCLSAHKRMAHAKEVNHEFKCTFGGCDVGYSIRKYLEEHLKTHDPNYQFLPKQKLIICQYCAKEYETFFQLNRHIQKVHEN